jgi:chromosome segregation protein
LYLAELELHGFKSFAQKTSVKFGNGITAIVGPNGCGKSNIVDALRWALGEQRPSLLRSSAMTNVIFNGTSTKKALGMAEVSITIQNNKGILPVEFNDITITRRLYRSGESEYLLNKVPCRLRDIVELFMDTGMGSNAYSVIELKMVEEILADKNNDRRKLFEEAAGVTKYKEKRKQTIKKLDETRNDMLRVEDILVEIRKKVKSLQIQAGRAQRARQYENDLHRLDKALSAHEYRTIRSELEPLLQRIINADKDKEELNRTLDTLEQQLSVSRESLSGKETAHSEAIRLVSELNEETRNAETTITIDTEKIAAEQGIIAQYEQDVVMGENEIREFRKAITSAEDLLKQAEVSLQHHADTLESAREQLDEARQETSGLRRSIEDLSVRYRQTSSSMNALQNQRVRIESKIEGFSDDLERLDKQIEARKSETDQFSGESERLLFERDQAREQAALSEARLDEARQESDRLQSEQERLKDHLREEKSRQDALKSEIALLESLARSDEAFPSSVKYLRQHIGEFTRFDMLSELFSVPVELAVALESVLGDAVNYIVMDTVEDARKAFELLKRDHKGKATIIPMELLSGLDVSPADGSLAWEVRCAPKFEPLRDLLLGRVRVFGSQDEALKALDATQGTGITGVTLAGELLSNRVMLRSGSADKNEGLRVGLKERIEQLHHKSGDADVRIDEYNEKLQSIIHARDGLPLNALTVRYKEMTTAARKADTDYESFSARRQLFEKNLEEMQQRRQRAIESRTGEKSALEALEPRGIEMEEQLEQLLDDQHRLRADLQQKEDTLQRLQSRFSEAQLQHQKARNESENITRDIDRASSGIAGVKKRLEARAQRATESKDRILASKQEINVLTEQLKDLRVRKKSADEALAVAEEETARHRGRIHQLEEDLRVLRKKRDVHMELVHHLTMARERFDMQQRAIADHVWEEYGLLMDQVTEPMPEDTDPATVKETITMLRERLKNIGEVNKLAIEEYEVEKKRLDTYESQMHDLNEAELKLRETINDINNTANKRFTETFKQIREHFKNVFHTLFEETDHCDLVLEDDAEDPLDRKINIIANPRGKRPSNIEQLSGGEKTLTAIALLFAIYLVKPSPFCILDEVDAPLDDANIDRFSNMIRKFSHDTQFIIITHNKKTMEKSEMLYGVTMPETGVSKLVAVKME